MKKRLLLELAAVSAELKRRGVYPVIAAYAVVSWVLLQVGEVTFAPMHLPEWSMTALIVAVIAGFPIVLVLAWFFDLTWQGIRLDTGQGGESSADADRPSIAVLPFTDMSSEQDQAFFCEGVAEEILNALTKIRQLRVAARSSSFQFRSIAGDVRQIGRELGVKSVLEGSVRKSGDHLRVTAQLIDVATGYHLWSKSFDEEPKDIFEIQDEIAKSIAASLLETITPTQQDALKTTSSKNVTAYEYYLRGRQFIYRFRKLDIEYARQMFHQAIRLDPHFALAWAGYADCYSLLVMYADPIESYRSEARKASSRALKIDPNLAEAHASKGLAWLISDEYEKAEGEFRNALALNAHLYQAYYYYARARFHQGDLEMAAELFRKAADVDPADYQSRCLRVQILRGVGRTDDARRQAKEVVPILEQHLKWNPDDARAFHLGAGSLIALGQVDRAKRWLRRALEIDPDDSVLLYNVACNFATLGETNEALDFLARAIDKGMVSEAWMRNDKDLDEVRTHPRFEALLEQLAHKGIA